MRSDVKALLKLFAWSFTIAVLVIGVGIANAMGGWLTKEVAAYLMLGFIVIGAVIGWRWFGSALMKRPPDDKPADPDATASRRRD